MTVVVLDRYLVPILGVLCAVLTALCVAEDRQTRVAIDRAMASANLAHQAIVRERVWRASAMAVVGGARDTDAALQKANTYLAVCVGRLALAQQRTKR